MSLVRQCDRCGKVFHPYVQPTGCKGKTGYVKLHVINTKYLENVYDGNTDEHWDLCLECSEQLNKLLENPNTDVIEQEIDSDSVIKASDELESVPVPVEASDEGDEGDE